VEDETKARLQQLDPREDARKGKVAAAKKDDARRALPAFNIIDRVWIDLRSTRRKGGERISGRHSRERSMRRVYKIPHDQKNIVSKNWI